jgi:hypothetical protein
MKEGLASTPAGDGQSKSHEISAMEGAENLPSGLRGDDKQGNWNYVYIRGLPNCPFDTDAGLEFGNPAAGANEDAIANLLHGSPFGWSPSLLRFHDLNSSGSLADALIFAATHNCSSFSFDKSDKRFPEREASLSIS